MDKFNGLLDYMDWRGDLNFESAPFNDIDALILCQILYMPFDNIVPGIEEDRTVTIAELEKIYFENNEEHVSSLGVLIPQQTTELLQRAAWSVRFGNVRAGYYKNDVDLKAEKQFSAIGYYIDDKIFFLAFRGTDDTIVGWKEDFNMSFMSKVPAQLEAKEYADTVVKSVVDKGFNKSIMFGGHSKGGNLSVYAGINLTEEYYKYVDRIYNFDGPGFGAEVIESQEYIRSMDKIHTLVPESSVIGMLLGHEEAYTVIKSNEAGLMQHNPFSWQLLGANFITVNQVSTNSDMLDKSLKKWISSVNPEEMEKFVDTLFKILYASRAETLTELTEDTPKKISAMVKCYKDTDEETRKMIHETFKSLVNISGNTFIDELKKKLPWFS